MEQLLSLTPYQQNIEEIFQNTGSRQTGLTPDEVLTINKRVGRNTIPKLKVNFYERYLKPVLNLMMLILFLAAGAQIYMAYALGVGGYFGPVTILVILFINIIIGMRQQFKAEKTLEALERLTQFKAIVRRGGQAVEIKAEDLVPGDILLLKQGDYIAADARIFESNELAIDESVLTGEVNPVQKSTTVLTEGELSIQEQSNMVFNSTFVAMGNGKAVVINTGLNTEIGKISEKLLTKEKPNVPLQRQMNKLATGLGIFVILTVITLFVVQYLREPAMMGDQVYMLERINWLISIAVAAIPLNFPLITTLILLSGVLHLSREQTIVRNLNAVETMGRLTVICSDKTGTLTENQMTVTKVFYNSTVYDVSGIGYFPEGEIQLKGQKINPLTDVFFWNMLINGAVNNNTEFSTETVKLKKGTQDIIKILGLPTEGALLTLAQKAGINPKLEQRNYQVLKELSFSSQRKRMTKIVQRDGNLLCFTKGAPEKILEICTQIIQNGEVVELDSALRQQIGDQITSFAMSGLRTLALGFKNLQNSDNISQMSPDQIEQDLIFTGMVGMLDPPQEGVKESIEICKNAGIKVVMITGDHPTTATSIAKAVNIYQDGDGVASGSEIQGMNVDQITQTSVFARVGPEDKLNIVKAFQAKDYIVAMTGDGVNDALALENADVGIAMGLKGTDVAKNAADIVITDDSFNTIETALYHGRGLFNNIRSNIVFLLVCNLMEIAVLVTIYLITGAEIFTAFHLIILYATIHFFPPFGLMFDKYDPFIMKDPPKKVNEPLINRTYLKMMFLQILTVAGVLIGVWWLVMSGTIEISLINMENPLSINPFNGGDVFGYVNPGLDPWLFENGDHPEILKLFKAQTMCFCTLIISEVWIALESRSTKTGIFKAQFNIALTILILIVFGILAAITQYDLFQSFMHIINLSLFDWGVILGASFIVIILTEIWKKL